MDPCTVRRQARTISGHRLKTPRAAAIAGIVFSVLLLIIFGLLRLSVPADPMSMAPGWIEVRILLPSHCS